MQPDPNDIPWWLVLLTGISGMVGGCGSASFQVLSGRQLTLAIVMAYGTLGFVLGMFSFLVIAAFEVPVSLEQMLLIAGTMGGGSTVTVAGIRFGVRAILKWRGIEADISIRRISDD